MAIPLSVLLGTALFDVIQSVQPGSTPWLPLCLVIIPFFHSIMLVYAFAAMLFREPLGFRWLLLLAGVGIMAASFGWQMPWLFLASALAIDCICIPLALRWHRTF